MTLNYSEKLTLFFFNCVTEIIKVTLYLNTLIGVKYIWKKLREGNKSDNGSISSNSFVRC